VVVSFRDGFDRPDGGRSSNAPGDSSRSSRQPLAVVVEEDPAVVTAPPADQRIAFGHRCATVGTPFRLLVSSLECPSPEPARGGSSPSVAIGRTDPAGDREALGALDEKGAPLVGQGVGRPVVGSRAFREEAAPDEGPQVRLESGSGDAGIPALEGVDDSALVAGPSGPLAAGDGLETVALEGGEFDPRRRSRVREQLGSPPALLRWR